jgi:hypothetical protein
MILLNSVFRLAKTHKLFLTQTQCMNISDNAFPNPSLSFLPIA